MRGNNKNRFISMVLSNSNLTAAQKSRVVSLISRDAESEETGTLPSNDDAMNNLPIYRSPKDISKFLLAYNQDPILKYTCHPIDDINTIKEIVEKCGGELYSVKNHQSLIALRFSELYDKKKYNIDSKVMSLIRVYLTGKDFNRNDQTWSSLKIAENWHSKKLFDWSENNPGKIPNPGDNIAEFQCNEGYMLPKPIVSNLTGKKITTFGDVVMYFKSLFHIKRSDNLRDKLLYIYHNGYRCGTQDSHPWEEHLNLSFGKFDNKIELFTSVDKLLQAFVAILRICVDVQKRYYTEIPHIEVGFYKDPDDGRVCFSVHHINSEYQKTVEDTISRIGEQQRNLINNQINGICDLYIEANFGHDACYRVNLWDGNDRNKEVIPLMPGVKYILKF